MRINVPTRRLKESIVVALVTLLLVCDAQLRNWVPVLTAGKPLVDKIGKKTTYHWYAEERAVVTPTPVLEIQDLKGNKLFLHDVFPALPKARESKKFAANGRTLTRTKTVVDPNWETPTARVVRYSRLQWWVASKPAGAGDVAGQKIVEATEAHQFILPGMKFPLSGYYNVRFNVSRYNGGNWMWNQTIYVDKQPQKMTFESVPQGYNGTALDPAPEITLRDFVDNPIYTSTPLVTLVAMSVPDGATVAGSLQKRATLGSASFKDIIVSLPGTYAFRFDALLSDGSTLRTIPFLVNVKKAIPVEIVLVQPPNAVTRFIMLQNPVYRIRDARGFVDDARCNLSVALGFNEPSVRYVGLSSLGKLWGTTKLGQTNYSFTFTDLMIDLPGTYEIEATLTLDGEVILTRVDRFQVADLPTWEVTSLTVNTIGNVEFFGLRPNSDLVRVKLSSDDQCITDASDRVTWTREGPFVVARNISFVPYKEGIVYFCMQLQSQKTYVPLLQRYLPSFNELFPLVYTFTITDVASCRPLDAIETILYQRAGWDTAQENRRYGCNLKPPASGTIPPCTCPAILACQEFRHKSFQPPNLNIGRCVCCKPWVMGVAGSCTALFLLGLLFVIYQWV